MSIIRYKADSPAGAFELASKDASKWTFVEMEALSEMAKAFRDGYAPMKMGSRWMCFCHSGNFMLFDDAAAAGFGISIVSILGHESEVADPIAKELLEYHRSRRGEALFADQLIVFSESITTLADLDRGYGLLVKAGLVHRAQISVFVKDEDGQDHQRLGYICHELPGSS